jgi:glycosyltransferase involved in cell wall biosynthesis
MISVCIATYNGEDYIQEQIESMLKQLSVDDEIIISDDGSTDKTIDILKSINSPIIRIYNNKGEHGYTPNFENALKQVKGDFIFISDQDDVWNSNKVKIMMTALNDCDFVVSDAIVVDENLKPQSESFFAIRKPYKSFWGNLYKFGYLGCCFAFKRCVLVKALPFPNNHKMCTHDNWIFLISKMFYKVKILDEGLVFYRRHHHNTSSGGAINCTSFRFKIKYRLYLICHLITKIRR